MSDIAPLRIAVVEEDRDRALEIVDGLAEDSEDVIRVFGDMSRLQSKITEFAPDIVLVDIQNPSRDTLEDLASVTQAAERPVAIFVDKTDPGLARAAVDAGVSAYVVNGLATERIRPILEVAIARFGSVQRLRRELEATREALEDRKVLERAKGLLMTVKGISEDEAYGILRKAAMDQKRRIADVSRDLVNAAEMLK